MKKKAMLALAIIMVLGSVKAMAEDSFYESDEYVSNTITKTYASEDDVIAVAMLDKISSQISILKSRGQTMDRVDSSESLSLGQAISKAESISLELRQHFDLSTAKQLSKELAQQIKSLKSK
ncbi:hypothetical protein ACLSU7_10005 [Bdellovibrio sp. HCB185ZH]|uniref:hypothetical protein n=1 Tax=Bdellovibrio sp. HCB185ZH TaxID=3394235 RepID=UPI0039A5DB80